MPREKYQACDLCFTLYRKRDIDAPSQNRSQRNEISIDEPLNVDWDGNELLLSDILGSDPDLINRDIELEDEKSLLLRTINAMGERERTIMSMRFGLNGQREHTQKEVADILGISQSYISRLEKKIIASLKKEIEKATFV